MERSQKPCCVNIYKKNAGPQARKRHFAWKFTGTNAGPGVREARFVRACAVETHMDISQKPFYAVIYRKNAGPVFRARREHLH